MVGTYILARQTSFKSASRGYACLLKKHFFLCNGSFEVSLPKFPLLKHGQGPNLLGEGCRRQDETSQPEIIRAMPSEAGH